MATEYDINYDDSRFQKVESEKQAALTEHENMYDGMISNSDKFYQDQITANTEWEKKQAELQNQQTDFAIQQIEQQKADAQKDYTKEQSGAYVDWQTQSKQHGVRAEQIADKGLQNTGYSESMQVSMYNTYQNRVATARESINRIFADYNNKMTEARLQNNATLAEIAYKSQQARLELLMQQFQAKNDLLLAKANQKLEIENSYYNLYQDVLQQINTENALAEQIRQFNESLAEEQRQFDANFNRSSGGGGYSGRSYSYSGGTGNGYQLTDTEDDGMSKETMDSIVKAGIGPVTQKGLADKEAQGVVSTYKNANGNTIVVRNPTNYSTTVKPSLSVAMAPATSAKKSSSSSSSSAKKESIVTKAVNWVKGLFD